MNPFALSIKKNIEESYPVKTERPWKQYPEYITFKDVESDKWFGLIMTVSPKVLGLDGEEDLDIINLKADPDFIFHIMNTPGFLPAYHMNKEHWITLLLDGSISSDTVMNCVDTSFRIVTDTPTKRIYEAVKQIPKGKVATYGQVAAMAGDPKMARAVGNALHKNPDPAHIPCHRVVNARGELADAFVFGGVNEQAVRLQKEGVESFPATDGHKAYVDLSIYGM